jgi:hypothetical protein
LPIVFVIHRYVCPDLALPEYLVCRTYTGLLSCQWLP